MDSRLVRENGGRLADKKDGGIRPSQAIWPGEGIVAQEPHGFLCAIRHDNRFQFFRPTSDNRLWTSVPFSLLQCKLTGLPSCILPDPPSSLWLYGYME